MSLLSAIPGLAMHQVATPALVAPAFDRERASRLMRDAISLLNSFYPAGAMEWLRLNRPDVSKELEGTMADIDAAVLVEDLPAVTATLDKFVKYHRKAFSIFEGRPPVVEVQERLI